MEKEKIIRFLNESTLLYSQSTIYHNKVIEIDRKSITDSWIKYLCENRQISEILFSELDEFPESLNTARTLTVYNAVLKDIFNSFTETIVKYQGTHACFCSITSCHDGESNNNFLVFKQSFNSDKLISVRLPMVIDNYGLLEKILPYLEDKVSESLRNIDTDLITWEYRILQLDKFYSIIR
jgi:hypothetical protein